MRNVEFKRSYRSWLGRPLWSSGEGRPDAYGLDDIQRNASYAARALTRSSPPFTVRRSETKEQGRCPQGGVGPSYHEGLRLHGKHSTVTTPRSPLLHSTFYILRLPRPARHFYILHSTFCGYYAPLATFTFYILHFAVTTPRSPLMTFAFYRKGLRLHGKHFAVSKTPAPLRCYTLKPNHAYTTHRC